MKATAELKMLPVSVLKPAAYNPRKKLKPGDKEYEKIKNSITEFGFADPLVVNADMTIIGGHQRLTVAMELGYTEVPSKAALGLRRKRTADESQYTGLQGKLSLDRKVQGSAGNGTCSIRHQTKGQFMAF